MGRFESGDHIPYPLQVGRGVWLQVVNGAVKVADHHLSTGDGIGITETPYLEMIFTDCSDILLFDLGMNKPRIE